jgi:hypothetical protein
MPKTAKSSSPTVNKPQANGFHPTTEEIALRAYHIYLERGGSPGDPLEDWTRAERELLKNSAKAHRKPVPKSIAA